MSKFIKITAEVVAGDEMLVAYLKRAQISAAKKGGTFVGTYDVASDDFRKYGIVLPKGGMILPDMDPDVLRDFLAKFKQLQLEREETERKNALAEALIKFSARNNLVVLRSLMASPAYRDADLVLKDDQGREINTSYLKWLLEQNAATHLFESAISVEEVVVATAFSERLGQFFDVTPEGIKKLNRAWQAVEDADLAIFQKIIDANPDRAVVARGGTTPTISLFGVEYRFSTFKVADRYLFKLREQFTIFNSEAEADIANRIVAGEQPRYEEREESWSEGPKMRPEGNGRYIGGTEKVTVTFVGPHRVYSTGDYIGMHHAYQRLLKLRESGVNIKPRFSEKDLN